jgi:ABC-type transporter Mla maintaining outer membrane lipid asymmetry ATPase subunit MlaF
MLDRIDLEAVSFAWGSAPLLLHEITCTVRQGECIVISGQSGSGKSCLLELCAGLIRPASGRVLWNGCDIAALPKNGLLRSRQSIGYMFQVHALISNFTVVDNLALPLRNRGGLDGPAIMKKVRSTMETLSLSPASANRFPEALSMYECKAAALGRALISDPTLLILDEPLAGLDQAAKMKFIDIIIRQWKEKPMAVILTGHDFPDLPGVPVRRLALENGKLIPHHGAFPDRE